MIAHGVGMLFSLTEPKNLDGLRETYRATGAVSIPGLLPDAQARALEEFLLTSELWLEIFTAGGKTFEMPVSAYRELDREKRQILQDRIHREARQTLQYRYRSIRISDDSAERRERGNVLDHFAEFLNSREVLTLLRHITGSAEARLVDAQATDYRAGDFLTTHDDAVEGKNRLAAYVYGLTSRWKADWGGLLLFERDDMVSGFIPDFNKLRIFQVPMAHHVSMVAPWAETPRLSVTGWLRTRAGDGERRVGRG